MKLNVIIPCYNEEGNVELLHQKLAKTLGEIDYELIFINDGSKDQTGAALTKVFGKDPKHVRIINFSRNFGKDAAMYAGLMHANAKYSVIIDSDLQQNPKYLLTMIKYLDEHEDIDQVAMVNKERKEGILTRILKWGFYTFMNLISETKFEKGASDFRMFRANVVEAICSLSENNRFSKGIFAWIGFNTHYMEYEVEDRHSGKRFFNPINQWKYAFSGIINFSVRPLRFATWAGIASALSALIYLIVIICQNLINGNVMPGYPSLICLILLLGGIQLMAMGIIGEYLAKNFLETKKRPTYITKNKLGFKDDEIL